MVNVICSNCGEARDTSDAQISEIAPCGNCGSKETTVHVGVEERMPKIHEQVEAYSKDDSYPSKKKKRQELITGNDLRKDDKKWMDKTRFIDRDRNRYIEKVVDPDTGEVLRDVDEPLSDHFGRGSAKFNDGEDEE
jgi:uncharacterized FlaG/YvyC family protein